MDKTGTQSSTKAMPPVDLCFTDDFLFLTVALLIRQGVYGSQRGLLRQHRQ